MMVDRDLVTRKLLLIVSDLEPLGRVGVAGVDTFVADPLARADIAAYVAAIERHITG